MPILSVEGLNKKYEKFHLKDVSFRLEKGYIMGFIGLNGAGKTTTLKSILNMVHADSGNVTILGKDFRDNEIQLKHEIGYMFGGVDFYSKRKIGTITDVVKRFYPDWSRKTYQSYLKRFNLDEDKKIEELSRGMKVKYLLALALSHNASLFIFDEPTGGLDPAARDDLLEVFQELIEDGEKSILFSTQITSDLEKCADYITYINNGQIVASTTKDEFIDSYRVVKGTPEQLDSALKEKLIAYRINSFGFSGLMKTDEMPGGTGLNDEPANLEDIMIFYARKENNDA